jgi:2-polyprenyl-6-methoxyphenol hydroxylase-like FAD-dependent oxidoreductase
LSGTDIAIVGGGVAGLGAAIALSGRGFDITVLERRAEVGGIHRGDSLLPKSTELLEKWGLRPAIEAAGARPIHRMEIHAPGARYVYESPITVPDAPHPYFVLPHARLEAVLMEHALSLPDVRVLRPASAIDLVRADGGRVCGIRLRTAGAEEVLHCRLAIAADGQHSAVRKRLGIEFDAYRYDHAYLGLEADRPPGYRDAMRLHFHEEGGTLLMPHPDRIGVGVLVAAGSARHWLTMEEQCLSAELSKRAPILKGVPLHMQGAHVYELTRAHASRYVKDAVVLIGDAAHCTNPTAGQGMAMALTDAGAIAAALDGLRALDAAALDPMLRRFEARQWTVNQRLVRNSHWLANAYALRGPAWTALKMAVIMALARPAMHRVTAPLVARFTR